MHFCVFATRTCGGFSVPRKYGLNWFIPALANKSVGSLSGTTGDDGMFVCPCFLQKKSMNCCRISLEEGMTFSRLAGHEVRYGQGHELRAKVQGASDVVRSRSDRKQDNRRSEGI